MYCKDCLNQMLKKINDNDVIILESLLKQNANIPQCALSYDKMNEHFENDPSMTPHIIYTSLKRLNVLGFAETQKWSRQLKFYITDDGINLLRVVQENMEN